MSCGACAIIPVFCRFSGAAKFGELRATTRLETALPRLDLVGHLAAKHVQPDHFAKGVRTGFRLPILRRPDGPEGG
jgi:hypothetical protein